MKKTILLTGGNGFIGKNIRESYLGDKYNIIAPGSKELNLIDEDAVATFFEKNNIDVVLHAAGRPGHRKASFDKLCYENLKMFFSLEKQHTKYSKMLVLGSGAIYDKRNVCHLVKEDDYLLSIPLDEYSFGKYVGSKYIDNTTFNCIDLRLFGIFGKYEDYTVRFISNIICKSLFNKPFEMIQDCVFSYLFIDDLMPILEFFIENEVPHKSYNIVPNEVISLLDIAKIVQNLNNEKLEITQKKQGLGLEYSGANDRLKEVYKEVYFTPIHESVKKLHDWYLTNIEIIDKNQL